MRTLSCLLALVTLSASLFATSPWDHGALRVTQNGRYFQHADGTPFFWLADTGWLITQKLTREEIKTYLEDRRAKGFNVVQCCIVQFLHDESVYGSPALVDEDMTRPNVTPGDDPDDPAQFDYWDHVDYTLETAAANGIYLAMTPVWAPMVRSKSLTPEQVGPYVAWLAERYRDHPNVIWLNGGAARGHQNTDIWPVIGETMKRLAPNQLMSFHTFGRTQTSAWFQDTAWLDFNTFTSGHRRYDQDTTDGKKYGEDNWRYVLDDLALSPRKPTLDAEPSYENTPQGLHDGTQPYWNGADVRRYAYWAVFAGAAGHTYGENSVRQVYLPRDSKPASSARGYFMERLDAEGATQLRHLKHLILSRPFLDRVNDQSLVAGDEGEKYDRVLVTRGTDWLAAYIHTGREFTLQLGAISGTELTATWFDPRTGRTSSAGTHRNTGSVTFNPPGEPTPGNDWVLVLDDAAKRHPQPGTL